MSILEIAKVENLREAVKSRDFYRCRLNKNYYLDISR